MQSSSPEERLTFGPQWVKVSIGGELVSVAEYHYDPRTQSVWVTRMSVLPGNRFPGLRSRAFEKLAGAILNRLYDRNPLATLQHFVPEAVEERDAEE